MKLLAFDIETFPAEAYVWGIWNENIPLARLKHPGIVASWAAKWLGEGDEYFYDSLHTSTPAELHERIHGLIHQADAIVTYNGKRFDYPWLNTGFVTHGLPPLTPHHIDLLAVVRKQFKFPSYKLEYVVKALGIGEKASNEGFETWVGCMNGNAESWGKMRTYNIHDVTLLEGLYDRILPYINNHPSRSVVDGLVCPACGSAHYHKDGLRRTKAGIYQKYACNDCGHPFRGNENLAEKEKFISL